MQTRWAAAAGLAAAVLALTVAAPVLRAAAGGESAQWAWPPQSAAGAADDEAAAREVARTLTRETIARYGQCRREAGELWKAEVARFRDRHAAELRVFDDLPDL